ncbi:iron-sulfur cluster repair di-iron protein [Aquihabitans daechungensis]|uniref:iron-sulfur cluster repair di-iron protein n=1 Tax=Aquihabitans daechungensis TaxID=1052257 RepID=UPI003BA307D7
MTDTTTTRSLADLVGTAPDAARVLESFGLDYCCGGQRTLADACTARGVSPEAVLDALAALEPQPLPDWATMGPAALVDHLEQTHHAYLHVEMPRLSALAEKVAGVHGARHPELLDVRRSYEAIRSDLEPHLAKEERVLFPMIRELAAASSAPEPPRFHCGSLQNPIAVMLREHDDVGDQLAELRRLTDDFRVPADGCASYRALYEGLAALEADTHQHVHKENNLLFPAVVALEQALDPTHA